MSVLLLFNCNDDVVENRQVIHFKIILVVATRKSKVIWKSGDFFSISTDRCHMNSVEIVSNVFFISIRFESGKDFCFLVIKSN